MRKLAGNLKNNWKNHEILQFFSFLAAHTGIDQNGWKFGAMTCRSNCWWRDAVRLSWCLSLRAARLRSLPFFLREKWYIHTFHSAEENNKKILTWKSVERGGSAPATRTYRHSAAGKNSRSRRRLFFVFLFFQMGARARQRTGRRLKLKK